MDNATVNGNDMEEVANSFIMEPKKEEETDQVEASEDEAEVDDTPVEDTEGEGEEDVRGELRRVRFDSVGSRVVGGRAVVQDGRFRVRTRGSARRAQ